MPEIISIRRARASCRDRFHFRCPGGSLGELFAKRVILPAMEKAPQERMDGLVAAAEEGVN
jgi:hypothetical protein